MTKQDLIEMVAKGASISKTAAAAAVDAFIEGVMKGAKKGKLTLVGFGSFEKVKRKARKGRNPQTGKEINIPAKNAVKFKPGKKFKDAVL